MNTLLDYVTLAASEHPNRLAVSDAVHELTYAELAVRSDTLAAELCRLGVGPARRVVIQLPPGTDLVVAIWAVLKTGAAYVPVDPATPGARRTALLDRVRPRVVITAGEPPTGFATVDVTVAYRAPDRPPAIRVDPADPAYILHTSGSTGVPKGVVLTHRNATAFVDWAVDEFQLDATDRIVGHAPAHFDLSVLDLFGAAKAGAALFPAPTPVRLFGAGLATFLEHVRATTLYCVPTALTMLSKAATPERLATLRRVLFAGEVCPPSTLRAMLELAPRARFANLFGPTETNVCTFHDVTPPYAELDALPIGRPIPGVTARVMATPKREAAVGEPGELYVVGPTVAAGYWDDPEQTASRFISTTAGRAYRTGDVVVADGEGVLYFRGRVDRQVKTRGHRVELDEVETVLRAHPAVVDAVVSAVPDDTGSNRLVAVVLTRQPITAGQLRRGCAAELPGYAVPTAFRLVAEFPLTPNGKVDRAALSVQCGQKLA